MIAPRLFPLFSALALVASGCLAEGEKGLEEAFEDGKLDSHLRPTDHGPIAFDVAAHSVLTDAERYHAWEFELSGDAEITAVTSYSLLGQRKTDTVLYLYRETPTSPTGWGPYIARNDDYDGKVYSRIIKQLGAGKYRALVKGYATTTRGKFKLTVSCDGPGCVPAIASDCLFGDTYNDIPGVGALVVSTTDVHTSPAGMTELDRRRVVLAVQQSSHTDVTTAEEAFGRVDQSTINIMRLWEPAAARTWVAFEYGAGDNSYGAIFDGRSDRIVAKIHDGDLLECAAVAETCRLGSTYRDIRDSADFTVNSTRVVTEASQLEPIEQKQALRALQEAYDDITTLAQGLALADDDRINVVEYVHNPTNTDLVAYEFGAGDNSYGAVMYYRSLEFAAAINDGDLYGCSLFAPRGQAALGESCRGTGDCTAGLPCRGVFAGAGKCAANVSHTNNGNECTSDAACGTPLLVCHGLTRDFGLCGPAWMRDTFADPASTPIPDNGVVERRVIARGLASVDMDVTLKLRIAHPRASQLRITLANRAGAEVLVHAGTAADDGHDLVIERPILGFSGDEAVNGDWTLAVQDRAGGQVGTIQGWELTLGSRWD
jgi:hypothetical protein